MKHITSVFLFASSLFAFALSIPAFAAGGYGNARDLQTDCQATLKFSRKQASAAEMYASGYCYGFLSGVADTLALNEKLPETEDATPEDLAHIVLRYFDQHPEVLRLSAATAVKAAFTHANSSPQGR